MTAKKHTIVFLQAENGWVARNETTDALFIARDAKELACVVSASLVLGRIDQDTTAKLMNDVEEMLK